MDAIHGYFLYPTVFSFVRDTYKLIEAFLNNEPLPPTEPGKWIELIGE